MAVGESVVVLVGAERCGLSDWRGAETSGAVGGSVVGRCCVTHCEVCKRCGLSDGRGAETILHDCSEEQIILDNDAKSGFLGHVHTSVKRLRFDFGQSSFVGAVGGYVRCC